MVGSVKGKMKVVKKKKPVMKHKNIRKVRVSADT